MDVQTRRWAPTESIIKSWLGAGENRPPVAATLLKIEDIESPSRVRRVADLGVAVASTKVERDRD